MSKYEIGTCNNEDLIYVNIKGRYDKRFTHLHLTNKDAKQLANDINMLLNIKNKGTKHFNINYTSEDIYT